MFNEFIKGFDFTHGLFELWRHAFIASTDLERTFYTEVFWELL